MLRRGWSHSWSSRGPTISHSHPGIKRSLVNQTLLSWNLGCRDLARARSSSCRSCTSGFLSLGLTLGVLQGGAVSAGLGHGPHALDTTGRLQQEGDHLGHRGGGGVKTPTREGRLIQETLRPYLLVVVGSQQQQQREGESDVGTLGHVLVRHFPLLGRTTMWDQNQALIHV